MADFLGPHNKRYRGFRGGQSLWVAGDTAVRDIPRDRKARNNALCDKSRSSGCEQRRQSSDSRVDLSGQSAVRLRREGLVVIGKRVGDTARLERSNP